MEKWQRFSRLKLSLALYQTPPWTLTPEQLTQFEPRYARQLRLESRVVAHAPAFALDVSEEELRQAVSALDQRLGQADLSTRWLTELGLDGKDLYQAMTHEVLLDKVLDRVAQDAPLPTQAEAAQWYAAHRDKFIRPEQRECSHILLTVDEEQPDCRPAQVTRRMADLHQRLSEDLSRFADVAKRHSQCPTALDGGNLGWVSRGLLYESLEQRLFTLAAGQLSDVVTSPMGLHILYCRDIRPAAPIPEADALANVNIQLRAKARQRFQRQWLADMDRSSQTI